ncbi:MAG: two-component sensor histidine kinase, partial [Sciscionella sp.]|nr:two-component sensor histidine kinase [Sciscionella sp.]
MMGPFRAVVGWWRRRSLRLRITIAVSVCSLAILLGLAKAGAGLIGVLQIDSVDATLRPALDGATARVSAGAATLTPSTDVQRRVLDTAGDPLDGQPKPVLDAHELDALKSGGAVLRTGDDPPH